MYFPNNIVGYYHL